MKSVHYRHQIGSVDIQYQIVKYGSKVWSAYSKITPLLMRNSVWNFFAKFSLSTWLFCEIAKISLTKLFASIFSKLSSAKISNKECYCITLKCANIFLEKPTKMNIFQTCNCYSNSSTQDNNTSGYRADPTRLQTYVSSHWKSSHIHSNSKKLHSFDEYNQHCKHLSISWRKLHLCSHQ